MKRPSFRGRAACMLGSVLAGCAAPTALQPGIAREVRAYAIPPNKIHEECARLRPGDAVDYRFSSTVPVDFNIHYHEGKAVIMPVTREKVSKDAATFRALTEQDYCLMWEAGVKEAKLDYRILIVPARDR